MLSPKATPFTPINSNHEREINEIREAMEIKLTEILLTNDNIKIKIIEQNGMYRSLKIHYEITTKFQRYNIFTVNIGSKMSGFSYKVFYNIREQHTKYTDDYKEVIKMIQELK